MDGHIQNITPPPPPKKKRTIQVTNEETAKILDFTEILLV